VMHRRWTPLAVWALMLGGTTALVFVFTVNAYYWALLGGAAAATALLAAYYLWRPPLAPVEYVPELSYGTLAVAAGLATTVIGIPFGLWLSLPGLGLVAVGLGGVLNELRVERGRE
jgi:hypothetical protein